VARAKKREIVSATLPFGVRSIVTRSRWPGCSSQGALMCIQKEARA
jgi:hypothetical protein